jgi:hypothetical protein
VAGVFVPHLGRERHVVGSEPGQICPVAPWPLSDGELAGDDPEPPGDQVCQRGQFALANRERAGPGGHCGRAPPASALGAPARRLGASLVRSPA